MVLSGSYRLLFHVLVCLVRRAQAVGSAAAVQANISVPGMIGTHSALDTDLLRARHEARMAGVGYRPGEPYAKWGRFACEIPAYHHRSGLDYTKNGVEITPTQAPAVPRAPVWPSTDAAATGGAEEGDTVAADTDNDHDDGNTQGRSTKGPSSNEANANGQGVGQRFPETSERRTEGSTPAYLQVKTVKSTIHAVPKVRASLSDAKSIAGICRERQRRRATRLTCTNTYRAPERVGASSMPLRALLP